VGKEYGHRGKSEEKKGEWRKLHNEELTDLFFLRDLLHREYMYRV
jgi:hypothetical protein